jgi:hypothetical protein
MKRKFFFLFSPSLLKIPPVSISPYLNAKCSAFKFSPEQCRVCKGITSSLFTVTKERHWSVTVKMRVEGRLLKLGLKLNSSTP